MCIIWETSLLLCYVEQAEIDFKGRYSIALELQESERLRTFKLAGIECLTDTSPFQEVYLFNILCDLARSVRKIPYCLDQNVSLL